ncbi:MAG: hypothetical protein IPH64_02740 [Comamonadaceae bacterium]|nr:hypothetical protein [Comamonadaceae bacterium]
MLARTQAGFAAFQLALETGAAQQLDTADPDQDQAAQDSQSVAQGDHGRHAGHHVDERQRLEEPV